MFCYFFINCFSIALKWALMEVWVTSMMGFIDDVLRRKNQILRGDRIVPNHKTVIDGKVGWIQYRYLLWSVCEQRWRYTAAYRTGGHLNRNRLDTCVRGRPTRSSGTGKWPQVHHLCLIYGHISSHRVLQMILMQTIVALNLHIIYIDNRLSICSVHYNHSVHGIVWRHFSRGIQFSPIVFWGGGLVTAGGRLWRLTRISEVRILQIQWIGGPINLSVIIDTYFNVNVIALPLIWRQYYSTRKCLTSLYEQRSVDQTTNLSIKVCIKYCQTF